MPVTRVVSRGLHERAKRRHERNFDAKSAGFQGERELLAPRTGDRDNGLPLEP